MKTRIILFTAIIVFISITAFSQDEKPVRMHEIGLSFSSLNSFGLQYKTGSEKTLLRLSALSLNMGNDSQWGRPEDSLEIKQQHFGVAFRLGFEKHVPIVSKLDFIWGFEGGINFTYQKNKAKSLYNNNEQTQWRLGPSVNLVLGVTYTFAGHFVLGAELTPDIYYNYGEGKTTSGTHTAETTTSTFGAGFSNNPASLSLAYRFGK